MPRYRSRPKFIEAIQFNPANLLPQGVLVRLLREQNKWQVYNQLHESWIDVNLGDYIRVDLAPKDVYPIARDYMNAHYEAVEEVSGNA